MSSLFDLGSYTSKWANAFYTQAGVWWGEDPQDDPAVHAARAPIIERLCGSGSRRILDLGAGSGRTGTVLADRGHAVIGVEFNPTDVSYAHNLLETGRAGSLTIVQADFYTVQLEGRFDVVCWWQGFGLGSDADQRRMLHRIADEWLSDSGCALIDVYNPIRPARHAGEELLLEPLPGVPGSVEMIERCYFDPVYCRWIDEWQPTQEPDQAIVQTLRCYTPADLLLLLEGTGLALKRIEVDGEEIDFQSQKIALSETLLEAWGYLAQLVPSSNTV